MKTPLYMKKIIFLLLSLTLAILACDSNSFSRTENNAVPLQQDDNNGVTSQEAYQYGDTIQVHNSYNCKDVEQFPRMEFATVNILNNDSLEILNGFESGYGGYSIRIIVDKNLQVKKLKYDEWSDDIG